MSEVQWVVGVKVKLTVVLHIEDILADSLLISKPGVCYVCDDCFLLQLCRP